MYRRAPTLIEHQSAAVMVAEPTKPQRLARHLLVRGEAVNALKRAIYTGRVESHQAKRPSHLRLQKKRRSQLRETSSPVIPLRGSPTGQR